MKLEAASMQDGSSGPAQQPGPRQSALNKYSRFSLQPASAPMGRWALREVLEGLADPHTGPVKGPGQADQDQKQQRGPRGVDSWVGPSVPPRSSLEGQEGGPGQNM